MRLELGAPCGNGLDVSAPSSLLRSALIGLSAGVMLSGLFLFVLAVRTRFTGFDCTGLSVEECLLEQRLATDWARTQLMTGTALTLLGLGGLLWQRSAVRREGPTP